MLSAQDVVSAYKMVLGRPPESEAVVNNYILNTDFEGLFKALTGSQEFARRMLANPKLFPIPSLVLYTDSRVQHLSEAIERLILLPLQIWDRSILLIGPDASALVDFFLNRLCRVDVVAPPETLEIIKIRIEARPSEIFSNLSLLPMDSVDRTDISGKYDVVYGDMPSVDADALRGWIDWAAQSCAETIVIDGLTAVGGSEDVFVLLGDGAATSRALPTRKWMTRRLQEHFSDVYLSKTPTYETPATTSMHGMPAARRAVFVASRATLETPDLLVAMPASLPLESLHPQ